MLRHTLGFALAIVTIGLSVSCGSDSENNNNAAGAAGGAGGSSGAGGSGGEEDAGGVACGNNRCMAMAGVMGEPCCIDQFTSICGFRRGSQCAPPPATDDPRCESVTVPVIGRLASCCTPSGDCGIIAPQGFGNGGCTELSEAQREADEITGRFRDAGAGFDAGFMFDGGFGITLPPPQRCDR
jgi:hypothetical protein